MSYTFWQRFNIGFRWGWRGEEHLKEIKKSLGGIAEGLFMLGFAGMTLIFNIIYFLFRAIKIPISAFSAALKLRNEKWESGVTKIKEILDKDVDKEEKEFIM